MGSYQRKKMKGQHLADMGCIEDVKPKELSLVPKIEDLLETKPEDSEQTAFNEFPGNKRDSGINFVYNAINIRGQDIKLLYLNNFYSGITKSKEAGIRTLVALDDQGGESPRPPSYQDGHVASRPPNYDTLLRTFTLSGRTSLKDEARSGRSSMSTNLEIVDRARQLERGDHRIITKDISDIMDGVKTSVAKRLFYWTIKGSHEVGMKTLVMLDEQGEANIEELWSLETEFLTPVNKKAGLKYNGMY
uniref:Uncharacterized protein n=1 Tax=Timema shepardi TaxID=629360 RepID=A0A7R9AT48_TIMSH|nr:unnamed protein product [Timema shepardi]